MSFLFRGFAVFAAAVIFTLGLSADSFATNGYFAHGYSPQNKALAGAGTALPLDSLAAATNPAGMVFVGKRADAGISFFNPNRSYTTGGTAFNTATTGKVKSDAEWFVIPALGFNWMMSKDYSLGVSIYGNGGMNTEYNATTFGVSGTGVDLSQLFIVPTYSRKLNAKHAVGISPIIAYQRFEAYGLAGFAPFTASGTAAKLTNVGYDDSLGFGARIGYMGEIAPGLVIGVSYQTRIWMDELDKYSELFAEQGDFDIPDNWSVGLAYNATDALTLVFDVQHIYYGSVDAIANPLMPNLTAGALGSNGGAGFGWDDMTIFKFGVQYVSSPDYTWRAGYSYGEQPIGSTEVLFNILAPAVIEQHITAGVTRKISDTQDLHISVMHALENDVSGTNSFASAFGVTETVNLEMNQWEVTAGYSWKFQ
ncbi:outer membrane protein transport protein [bacterium]|nr:outer membrane protein transport protein [bacterium]